MIIKLTWNRTREQWDMADKNDKFLQEFFDCVNMELYFPNLDKEKINLYRVTITKINKKERF